MTAARPSDGTVFEIAQGSGTITTLASFNGTNGADPYAGLVEDASGNLFGTTYRAAHRTTARCSRLSTAADDHHPGLLQRHQRGRPLGGL